MTSTGDKMAASVDCTKCTSNFTTIFSDVSAFYALVKDSCVREVKEGSHLHCDQVVCFILSCCWLVCDEAELFLALLLG